MRLSTPSSRVPSMASRLPQQMGRVENRPDWAPMWHAMPDRLHTKPAYHPRSSFGWRDFGVPDMSHVKGTPYVHTM